MGAKSSISVYVCHIARLYVCPQECLNTIPNLTTKFSTHIARPSPTALRYVSFSGFVDAVMCADNGQAWATRKGCT